MQIRQVPNVGISDCITLICGKWPTWLKEIPASLPQNRLLSSYNDSFIASLSCMFIVWLIRGCTELKLAFVAGSLDGLCIVVSDCGCIGSKATFLAGTVGGLFIVGLCC